MEKCKQSPRNSFYRKSQNIPPSCPQLSFFSFRSPPTALGCQATAVLLKLCQGEKKKDVETEKRESRARALHGTFTCDFPSARHPRGGVARPIRPRPLPPRGNVRACHVRCSRAIKGPNCANRLGDFSGQRCFFFPFFFLPSTCVYFSGGAAGDPVHPAGPSHQPPTGPPRPKPSPRPCVWFACSPCFFVCLPPVV